MLLIAVVFLVGALIGAVGIGGVLLVPALKYLGDIPLHTAIPACMMAYAATGIVGTIMFSRAGSISWPMIKQVCIGAIPGAFLGAVLLPWLSSAVLTLIIGLLVMSSGLNALRQSNEVSARQVSAVALILIGLITGIGSSLTGTGGPLILIPILIWRGVPVLTAIGLSQAIQIPISLMATLGNYLYGELDIALGLILAVTMVGGTLLGAYFTHKLPLPLIKKSVAALLICVGGMMLYSLA